MSTECSQIFQQLNQIFISTARLPYCYNCMLAFGAAKLPVRSEESNPRLVHVAPLFARIIRKNNLGWCIIKPVNGQIIVKLNPRSQAYHGVVGVRPAAVLQRRRVRERRLSTFSELKRSKRRTDLRKSEGGTEMKKSKHVDL